MFNRFWKPFLVNTSSKISYENCRAEFSKDTVYESEIACVFLFKKLTEPELNF